MSICSMHATGTLIGIFSRDCIIHICVCLSSMEASQPLSIESFSYSWLANLKPSFESPGCSFRVSIDASDDASFIEMDPKLSPSKRFFVVHHQQDFSFELPTMESPPTLVHADELILNGSLVPLFFKSLNAESYDSSSDSTLTTPVSSPSQENARFWRKSRSLSLRRYQRFPKRIVQKYLDLVRPFLQRIRRGRSDPREQEAKNWEFSSPMSPRISEACSADNWRRSCDSESSIYEAVLHCKRTIRCN